MEQTRRHVTLDVGILNRLSPSQAQSSRLVSAKPPSVSASSASCFHFSRVTDAEKGTTVSGQIRRCIRGVAGEPLRLSN